MHFWGRIIFFSSLNFFFLKNESGTFMNIWKHFFKDKNVCLKKPRTLGAWNRQFSSKGGGIWCSYAFLGICVAILRGRDLIFCMKPHISIFFTDIKYFFNLDNLEPAPNVRGFFRHKFLFLKKKFQIFINVLLLFFKKTNFKLEK